MLIHIGRLNLIYVNRNKHRILFIIRVNLDP